MIPFFGDVVLNQVFGYFSPPSNLNVLGMQIFAQEIPTGANVTVDIVNSSGVEQTKIGTLNAGNSYQTTTFGSPLAVTGGDFIQLKIKSVGSGVPGGWLTVALVLG